jgi:hypothetical protein
MKLVILETYLMFISIWIQNQDICGLLQPEISPTSTIWIIASWDIMEYSVKESRSTNLKTPQYTTVQRAKQKQKDIFQWSIHISQMHSLWFCTAHWPRYQHEQIWAMAFTSSQSDLKFACLWSNCEYNQISQFTKDSVHIFSKGKGKVYPVLN